MRGYKSGWEMSLRKSTLVMQWMAIGVLFNSLGRLAFTFVQGVGKAKWTGLLHMAELPFYLGLLFFSPLAAVLTVCGSSTLRLLVDTVVLLLMVNILLPTLSTDLKRIFVVLGCACISLMSFMVPMSILVKIVWFIATMAIFAVG